jgi:hypothetical protein
MLGGLAAYLAGRRPAALACFALLPLAKEPLALLPLTLAVREVWRNRARIRSVVPLVCTLIPGAAWWIYARIHFGASFLPGGTALAAPFSGWRRALVDAGVDSYSADPLTNQVGEETLVVLVTLLVLLAVACISALRLRGPVELFFIPPA